MIKAIVIGEDGKVLLMIGLSFNNLDRLRALHSDTYIKIIGDEIGFPGDVLIFSGETEESMSELFKEFIGPHTRTNIDPKLKQ